MEDFPVLTSCSVISTFGWNVGRQDSNQPSFPRGWTSPWISYQSCSISDTEIQQHSLQFLSPSSKYADMQQGLSVDQARLRKNNLFDPAGSRQISLTLACPQVGSSEKRGSKLEFGQTLHKYTATQMIKKSFLQKKLQFNKYPNLIKNLKKTQSLEWLTMTMSV